MKLKAGNMDRNEKQLIKLPGLLVSVIKVASNFNFT